MTQKQLARRNQNYLDYVNSFSPPTKHFATCGRAFMVGGFICSIGQFFRFMLGLLGLSGDVLAGTVSVLLIFLGTLLTGLGVYDRIGKQAGAGSIVPITGFHRVQNGRLRLRHGGKDVPRRRAHFGVRGVGRRCRRAHLLSSQSEVKSIHRPNTFGGENLSK